MCAAVTGTLLATGVSTYLAVDAAKKKEKAQDALNSYERQELNNAYENIQLDRTGADFRREQGNLLQAGLMDNARQGGIRGVFSSVPRIAAIGNNINREISTDLADQNMRRQYAIAGDNSRIEKITEDRDISNISALGLQIDAANQDFYNGLTGAVRGVGAGLNEANNQGWFDTTRETAEPVTNLSGVAEPVSNSNIMNPYAPTPRINPFGRSQYSMDKLSSFQF